MPVCGIYSFPKAGNTWLRHILGALFEEGAEAIPGLYRAPLSQARSYAGFRFYKLHSSRMLRTWEGEPLGNHAIHIRRHPLDSFVSWLNYLSDNVTGRAPIRFPSVDAITGTELMDVYLDTFIVSGTLSRFADTLDGYFDHNRRWLAFGQGRSPDRIRLVRYEDMLADPAATLGFLRDWLHLPPGRLEEMIARAETETRADGQFFWRRVSGNFARHLSAAQIERFLTFRGEDSAAFGYDADSFKPEVGHP